MAITIKRNCSSSITTREDKITFGSISITLDLAAFDSWNKIKDNYPMATAIDLLRWVIACGLTTVEDTVR